MKGTQGIKHGDKMFVMFYRGVLALKFSPERIVSFIKSGIGNPFDPATDKPMKDRILPPRSKRKAWIKLPQESLELVS